MEGRWALMGVYKDEQLIEMAPFQDVTIALSDLWIM
jgi:hypothetical protein